MKKLAFVLLAALLLTQLLVALPSKAAAPFQLAPPPAFTYTESVKVPTNIYVTIPCALGGKGEDVYLSGDLHIVSHITIDAGGGDHLEDHYQPQGISGVGMTSGARYQATGVTRYGENFRALPYNYTFVNNFRIIGEGPGNNYLLHETFHITVNANGELTASADNFGVDCK